MKAQSFFIFIVVSLWLTACETSVTNPSVSMEDNTTMEFQGGLNISFDSGESLLNKKASVIKHSDESYSLVLQLIITKTENVKRETASLQINIPFNSSDGILPAGNYRLLGKDIGSVYSNYESIMEDGDFSRISFKGKSATYIIRESSATHIKGSIIIELEQLAGIRMRDGQLEDIILSQPIRVGSHFDLELSYLK